MSDRPCKSEARYIRVESCPCDARLRLRDCPFHHIHGDEKWMDMKVNLHPNCPLPRATRPADNEKAKQRIIQAKRQPDGYPALTWVVSVELVMSVIDALATTTPADKPPELKRSVNDLTHEEWVECVMRLVTGSDSGDGLRLATLRKGIGNFLDSYRLHIEEGAEKEDVVKVLEGVREMLEAHALTECDFWRERAKDCKKCSLKETCPMKKNREELNALVDTAIANAAKEKG